MMWIVAGGVIGGLVGEGIGREFWLWGLILQVELINME